MGKKITTEFLTEIFDKFNIYDINNDFFLQLDFSLYTYFWHLKIEFDSNKNYRLDIVRYNSRLLIESFVNIYFPPKENSEMMSYR